MFIAFIVGNVIYYAAGIVLAFLLKDNRAFCKSCPDHRIPEADKGFSLVVSSRMQPSVSIAEMYTWSARWKLMS